jgi:hypothetical protein
MENLNSSGTEVARRVERVWRSVKYEEVVCYERDGSRLEQLRCFTKDEGGPLREFADRYLVYT